MVMFFLKKQPVQYGKKKINNDQSAKKPEMPQVALLKKTVKGEPEGICDFLSENKDRDGNQKVPGQYDLKYMGDLAEHIAIVRLFSGEKQITVDHEKERNAAVTEIIDRIIVHAHCMEADYTDAGQRFDQIKIRISFIHPGPSVN